MKSKLPIFIMAFLLLLTSCGSDDSPTNPEPVDTTLEVIVTDEAKVLDETAFTALQSISPDQTTFSFAGSNTYLDSLKVGDVMIGGVNEAHAEYGFLRKVVTIDAKKDGTTVTTEQAFLHEAIAQASIRFKTGDLKASQIAKIELAPGVKLNKGNKFRAFEFDFGTTFGDETAGIAIEGETYLDLDFFLDFDWEWVPEIVPFEVALFKTGIEIDQGASINVTGYGTYSEEEVYEFASIQFTPWTIMVGPVPVVFVPEIVFYIGVDGSISADITTGASENFNVEELGIKYTSDDGWSTIGETTFSHNFITPSLNGNAGFEAYVGPRASLLLYGIAGPFVEVEAYAEMEAELLADLHFNANFDIGLRCNAGAVLEVWGFNVADVTMELFDYPYNLFHIEDSVVDESLSITSPIANTQWGILTSQTIETYFTGPVPDEVGFFINGTEIGRDDSNPFAFNWTPTEADLGAITLSARAYFADHTVDSEEINISVVQAGWDVYNLKDHFSGLPDMMALHDIHILDANNIWISTQLEAMGLAGANIFYSSNQGASWSQICNGSNQVGNMQDAVYLDSSNGYSITGSMDFAYSTNGGSDWQTAPDLEYEEGLSSYALYRNTGSGSPILVYSDYSGDLYTNGPGLAYVNPTDHTLSGFISFADHGVTSFNDTHLNNPNIVTKGGKIFIPNMMSSGSEIKKLGIFSGGSFSLVNIGMHDDNDQIVDLFFLDDNTGWIISNYDDIFRTTDGGLHWQFLSNVTGVCGGFGARIRFVDATTGYCTDSYFGQMKAKLYKTSNGGITWAPIEETIQLNGLFDVEFYGPNLGFAVGGGELSGDYSCNIYRYTSGD